MRKRLAALFAFVLMLVCHLRRTPAPLRLVDAGDGRTAVPSRAVARLGRELVLLRRVVLYRDSFHIFVSREQWREVRAALRVEQPPEAIASCIAHAERRPPELPPPGMGPATCPKVFVNGSVMYVLSALRMQRAPQPGVRPITRVRVVHSARQEWLRAHCSAGERAAPRIAAALVVSARYNCLGPSASSFGEWLNEVFMATYWTLAFVVPKLAPDVATQPFDVILDQPQCGTAPARPWAPAGWSVALWPRSHWSGRAWHIRSVPECTHIGHAVVGISRSLSFYGYAARTETNHTVRQVLDRLRRDIGAASATDARALPHSGDRGGSRSLRLLWLRRRGRRMLDEPSTRLLHTIALGLGVQIMMPPSGISLVDLAALFDAADMVFFVHGADGANLVLLRPGTVVLQFCPCGYDVAGSCGERHHFAQLTTRAGGHYLGVHGSSDNATEALRRSCNESAPRWARNNVSISVALMTDILQRATRQSLGAGRG